MVDFLSSLLHSSVEAKLTTWTVNTLAFWKEMEFIEQQYFRVLEPHIEVISKQEGEKLLESYLHQHTKRRVRNEKSREEGSEQE